MRKTALRIAAVLLAGLWVAPVMAQSSYPDRPIQIVVPFAAGGSVDLTARLIAPGLSKELGQPVVVVNKAGGGATIGVNDVATAAPDGYTLACVNIAFAANKYVLKNVPNDPIKDFEPITMIAQSLMMIMVNPKVPANTLQEFIDWAKKQPPNSLNYGSVGIGSSGHLFTADFLSRTGLQMTHVPFTNGPMAPLAEGLIQLQIGPIPSDIPWIKDGKARALAVTSAQPFPSLPDVPTAAKTLPGFEAFDWPGLVAPKGTPKAIVDKIQQAVVKTINDPDVKARLIAAGSLPEADTPDQFRSFIAEQVKTWGDVAHQIGLQPQ